MLETVPLRCACVASPQCLCEEPKGIPGSLRITLAKFPDWTNITLQEILCGQQTAPKKSFDLEGDRPFKILQGTEDMEDFCRGVEPRTEGLHLGPSRTSEIGDYTKFRELVEVSLIVEDDANLVGIRSYRCMSSIDAVKTLPKFPSIRPFVSSEGTIEPFPLENGWDQ